MAAGRELVREQFGVAIVGLEDAGHDQDLDHRGRREAFVGVVAERTGVTQKKRRH